MWFLMACKPITVVLSMFGNQHDIFISPLPFLTPWVQWSSHNLHITMYLSDLSLQKGKFLENFNEQ